MKKVKRKPRPPQPPAKKAKHPDEAIFENIGYFHDTLSEMISLWIEEIKRKKIIDISQKEKTDIMKSITEYNDRAAKNPLVLAHIVLKMTRKQREALYVKAVMAGVIKDIEMVEDKIAKILK